MTDNAQTDTTPTTAPVQTEAPQEVSPREKFISSLPEEYRQDPIFANFDSWDGVARSYVSAAKMVGMDKNAIIALPKENTPEAMAPIWDKLGRPTDINGYKPEQYKDIIPVEVASKYAEIAHKTGISASAFEALFGQYAAEVKEAHEKNQAEVETQVSQWKEEVKKEFGAAYDQKMFLAKKAVESFGLKEVIEQYPFVFENPAIIKAFASIGEKTSEGMVLANGETSHGKLSPNEAKMELAKLQADPVAIAALTKNTHPQHEFYKNRRSELYKFAHPD